jgi:hypothetical protein
MKSCAPAVTSASALAVVNLPHFNIDLARN